MSSSVYIVGRPRGFFKHLMEINDEDIRFWGEKSTYEISSKKKQMLSKVIKSPVAGFFGYFKVGKVQGKDADYYLSFNRFLDSDKPYFIYLENPTALVHYSLYALKSPFIKKRLEKQINNPKLLKIVCMSEACRSTASEVLGVEIPEEKLTTIYPLVPDNPQLTESVIKEKAHSETIGLLYIAQGMRFYSKGGQECIKAFNELKEKYPIELTIITNVDQLQKETIQLIKDSGITLYDFNLTYQEMEQQYMKNNILLQPSSEESFGLTVLESIKSGGGGSHI